LKNKGHVITNGRTLWIWILIGSFAIGATITIGLKWDQIDRNKQDIEIMEMEQREQRDVLIRIDENVKDIKDDITELKAR